MTVESTQKDAEERMKKSLETLKHDFHKIRTGRAHSSLLDHIKVNYYGTDTPLTQVANVTVQDSRTLMVIPWEKSMVSPVEKAIRESDLGLNPATQGMNIRVPLPPMTEQRRKELIKVIHKEAELGKTAIRNVRRDANQHFKKMVKDKQLSEDDDRKAEDFIQKLTDKYIGLVDKLVHDKEAELMEV
ncbi:MAG: Ribosome-recycling factor [Pseudomonadota bacterium]|jgi:ribosome recycling factor